MIVADPGTCRRVRRAPLPTPRRNLALLLLFAGGLASAPTAAGAAATPSTGGLVAVFADDFESGTFCAWSSTVPPSTSTWYLDFDGDSFGDPAVPTESCAAPVDHVANAEDCDDASAATFPARRRSTPPPPACSTSTRRLRRRRPARRRRAGKRLRRQRRGREPRGDRDLNAIDDDCDGAIDDGFDLDDDSWTTWPATATTAIPRSTQARSTTPTPASSIAIVTVSTATSARRLRRALGDRRHRLHLRLSLPDGRPRRAAVAAADPQRDQVYVRAGTYTEILQPPIGSAIFGGYDAAWLRADRERARAHRDDSGGYVAAVDAWVTLRAASIAASFADLVLAGPTALSPGDNSQVVHSLLSTLDFARVTFLQGDGADGSAGGNGSSASASPAATGGDGTDGQEVVVDLQHAASRRRPGGHQPDLPGELDGRRGGRTGGSTDTSCPGIGGTCTGSQCNATAGLVGLLSGSGAGGGAGGGICGTPAAVDGTPGAATDGIAGAAQGGNGSIVANQWRAVSGGAGGVGSTAAAAAGAAARAAATRGPTIAAPAAAAGAPAAAARRRQAAAAGAEAAASACSRSTAPSSSPTRCSTAAMAARAARAAPAAPVNPAAAAASAGAASADTGPGGSGGPGGRGGHAGGGAGGSGGSAAES